MDSLGLADRLALQSLQTLLFTSHPPNISTHHFESLKCHQRDIVPVTFLCPHLRADLLSVRQGMKSTVGHICGNMDTSPFRTYIGFCVLASAPAWLKSEHIYRWAMGSL